MGNSVQVSGSSGSLFRPSLRLARHACLELLSNFLLKVSMICSLLGRLLPVATLAAPVLSWQQPLLHLDGDQAKDWFGHSVRPAGDVDGDGILDLIVGASQNQINAHSPFPGYARVYSGADLSVLHTFLGDGTEWTDGPDDHLGASVDGAGDVNGDGYDDLIVGAYKDDNFGRQNAGMVRVYSGLTGEVLYQLNGEIEGDRMGISVRRLGDLNDDGRPELLVGIYKVDLVAWNGGSVRVIDGATGDRIYEVYSDVSGAALGWVVAPLGDVNGDGKPDFISGAPQWPQEETGFARVFSGADGSLIHEVQGDNLYDLFGWCVAGVGDIDGDDVPDFAVGATQNNLTTTTGPGYVRLFSGATGDELLTLSGDSLGDMFGGAIDTAGDINGDGQLDVVIGAPRWRDEGGLGVAGYVRVHSGDDGEVLQLLRGSQAGDLFGWSVAGGFDRNGDGAPDIFVGCPEDILGSEGEGYAEVHSALCNPPLEHYCVSAPNSVGAGALISLEGSLSVEVDNARLVATGLPADHFGLFYYGPDQLQVPFGDGFRCVGGQVVRLPIASSDASGRIESALDSASSPAWVPGSRWNFQLWYRDPFAFQSGWNLSDAMALTVCP